MLYAYYKHSTISAFCYGAVFVILVQCVSSFYWVSNVAYCLHSALIVLLTLGTAITLVAGVYVGREALKCVSLSRLKNVFIVMFVCYELFIYGIHYSLGYGALGWLITISVISLFLLMLISLCIFIGHFTPWKTAFERAYYLKPLGFMFFFIFYSCLSYVSMFLSIDCGI